MFHKVSLLPFPLALTRKSIFPRIPLRFKTKKFLLKKVNYKFSSLKKLKQYLSHLFSPYMHILTITLIFRKTKQTAKLLQEFLFSSQEIIELLERQLKDRPKDRKLSIGHYLLEVQLMVKDPQATVKEMEYLTQLYHYVAVKPLLGKTPLPEKLGVFPQPSNELSIDTLNLTDVLK